VWEDVEGKVVALEQITIRAGTFKAYRIERVRVNFYGTRAKTTDWVDTNTGITIKSTGEVRRRNGNPDLWTNEAVSIKLGNT
jgi:hypothetical protein